MANKKRTKHYSKGYDKRVAISERATGRGMGHVPNSQGGPSGRPRGKSSVRWFGNPEIQSDGKYKSKIYSTKNG